MKFLPREEQFLQYFVDQANLILEAASILLQASMAGPAALPPAAEKITKIERKGDELMHAVHAKLNQTFITPLDPEDIHTLAMHLDGVLDYLEDGTHYLAAYQINPIPHAVIEITRRIEGCAKAIVKACEALSSGNSPLEYCQEVDKLEAEADLIERRAVADLFATESDPLKVMKLREVYDLLERTTDACEDVTDTLQTVVVKNG